MCVCVCVCVCLWGNYYDDFDIRLGIKVDQGLPCECHHIPRSSGKPLVVPKHSLSYCHMVIVAQDICRASEGDLELRGGSSSRLDLEMDLVD